MLNVIIIIIIIIIINTWLNTRACKYNVSALGTYFGCEGVKRTYLDLT